MFLKSMRFLLMVLISLGLLFRFGHLDRKIYWYDEVFTSLRAAGYTEAEVVQHFANTPIARAADLQPYQRPAPDRTLADTLRSLALEDTQHPPLYYGITHFWQRWVGSSVSAMRLLPALFSLLSLPCIYWLAQELWVKTGQFATSFPAWFAVGLWAISPLQLAYAQEARQYSLLATLTLVSTAALLRALRLPSRLNWGIYALSLAANLYTFPLSGLMAIAHGLYVLLLGFRPGTAPPRLASPSSGLRWISWFAQEFTSGLRSWWDGVSHYLLASCLGVAAFLPWAWVLFTNLEQAQFATDWINNSRTLPELSLIWLGIVGRVFYDRGTTALDRGIQLGFVGLVGYSFYFLGRHAPRSVWLLILCLTVVPVLPLIGADLVLGGIRSAVPRFFLPTLIGLQLAVVYLLSVQFSSQLRVKLQLIPFRPYLWRGIAAAVCCAAVISGVTNFQAQTWWPKSRNQEVIAVAELLNQAEQPLLLSDAEAGDLIALSYWLDPDIPLRADLRCYTCRMETEKGLAARLLEIPEGYKNIFLFHPRSSPEWQKSFSRYPNYRIEPITLKINLGLGTSQAASNSAALYRVTEQPI